MKQRIYILFFILFILQSTDAFAEENPSPLKLKPLFDMDSTRTFSPDFSTNTSIKQENSKQTKNDLIQTKHENTAPKKAVNTDSLKFQVSDPKDLILPSNISTPKNITNKENNLVKTKDTALSNDKSNPVITKTISEPAKSNINLSEPVSLKSTTVTKIDSQPKEKKDTIKKSETKLAESKKTNDNTKKDHIIKKEFPKTDQKQTEKKPSDPVKTTKDPAKIAPKDIKVTKMEEKKAVIKISPPIKNDLKPKISSIPEINTLDSNVKDPPSALKKSDLHKDQSNIDLKKIDNLKENINPESSKNSKNDDSEPNKNNDIDFYLQKYNSTLQGNANVNEFKTSLIIPFKASLFYKVLQENKNEGIELQTYDINSNLKPEAIVSYNVPLGTEGEYACQAMVLEPTDGDLNKLWVSELIPGKIDSVQIQDVNNDGQNDIIVISSTGGVSLYKSIRVYSFDKSRNTFNTVFAMNSIMEGIVTVKQNKILISETFPGGINRAALYMWNGQRFERLEL